MMKDESGFKGWIGTGLVVVAIFAFVNLLPPIVNKARRLCTVRPSRAIADAQALPTFARKYQTSCMTCHSMYPRLNAFGEAMRLNGLRWPGGEEENLTKEAPVKMGEEAYKKAWPNAVWPSDIPGTLPIAIRLRSYLRKEMESSNTITPKPDKVETGTKEAGQKTAFWEWEVFSAGTMGDTASWFGHFNIETDNEQDPSKSKTKTSLIGHLNLLDLLAKEDRYKVHLQLGTVGVEEEALPHYRSHSTYRMTATRSFLDIMQVPYPTTFHRPNTYMLRRGPGAMLFGYLHPSLQFGLGYKMAGDYNLASTKQENGFLQLAYKIGGVDYTGKRRGPEFPQPYQENSLGFGFVGVTGSHNQIMPTAASARSRDDFWRLGFDSKLQLKNLALIGGTVFGEHDNPYGTLNQGRARLSSQFGAVEYRWFPWLMTNLRYEEERATAPASLNLGKATRKRLAPAIHWLYRANINLGVEGQIFTDRRKDAVGNKLDGNMISFFMDFAI